MPPQHMPSLQPSRTTNYPLGIALGVLGAIALSTGGLLLRTIETASGWQVLVYRSGAFVVLLLLLIVIRYRGSVIAPFLRIGWNGIIIAIALGIGFAAYVFAILNTSVANAMFVLACAPVFSALIARVVLRERLSVSTWVIILVAMVGIMVMVAIDLSPDRLAGNAYALTAALTFAICLVMFRRAGDTDMLPATCLAGVVSLAIAIFMASGLLLTRHDLIVSLLLGWAQVGVGFICFTYAPRYILAAEVALLALLEPILSPIWVWLAYGEIPDRATMLGGSIVMACVLAFVINGMIPNKGQD